MGAFLDGPAVASLNGDLASQVDTTMRRVRQLLRRGEIDRTMLERVRQELSTLAGSIANEPPSAFPLNPQTRDAVYLMSEDPDHTLALYLAARDTGLQTPVHDHTTWAVIVGVQGCERNRFYARQPGGSLREIGQADVQPGSGVAMLAADLHSIATEAGVHNLQLHLYGRSFEAQQGRVMVDAQTGHARPFAGHPEVRIPIGRVTAAMARRMTLDGEELALVDLRTVAEHADQGHPAAASCIPLALLGSQARWRLPNRHARIVLLDDDDLGNPGQQILRAAGYTRVHVLPGGSRAWADAGYTLFTGFNVPGKAFGEHVDLHRPPPAIEAAALAAALARGDAIEVLDCRPLPEHQRMTLPGSVGLPVGEMLARIGMQVPDPRTPVVVHCAGRTRGIIAARMLIDAGCPNPVMVLRDGLIGWLLDGQRLALGAGQPAQALAAALSSADAVQAGDPTIDAGTLDAWLADSARSTYVFDVRSRAEFEIGHHPAARPVPAGELLQQLDVHVPVRRARVVIAGADVRARAVTRWLARMDWAEIWMLRSAAPQVPGPVDSPALPGGWRPPFDEHEQDPARMRAYLDWEHGLLGALERDGTLRFASLDADGVPASPTQAQEQAA